MIENLFNPTHLLFVLVICLLVFGPRRIPQMGRALGETIAEIKKAGKALQGDDEDDKK